MPDVVRLERIAEEFARLAVAQRAFPTEFRRTRTGASGRAWHVHPTGKQPEFDATLNDATAAMELAKRDEFIA
ncbi:MAG: hypothetical protein HOP29_04265 [Phycisphaerales bacterium]|nr:hypothetical protein [Phycisphaerales bacterium]